MKPHQKKTQIRFDLSPSATPEWHIFNSNKPHANSPTEDEPLSTVAEEVQTEPTPLLPPATNLPHCVHYAVIPRNRSSSLSEEPTYDIVNVNNWVVATSTSYVALLTLANHSLQ